MPASAAAFVSALRSDLTPPPLSPRTRALQKEEGRQVVEWFWEVVEGLQQADRRALLQFATACTNVPVGGFSRLQSAHGTYHPFTVGELSGRQGTNTLPRAAACFNTIFLPIYTTKEELEQQLKVAIGMGKGVIDEQAMVIGTRSAREAGARGTREGAEGAEAGDGTGVGTTGTAPGLS